MSDDLDLYDDLPLLNFGESVSKIDEERQYFKTQLEKKENHLQEIKDRIEHLESENKILEENISSLYQTAVNELKRKDQVIEELRRERENLIFRRKGRTRPNASSSSIPNDVKLNGKHKNALSNNASLVSSEQSVELCSGSEKNLETKCHSESSCGIAFSVECSSESTINSAQVQGAIGDCVKESDNINTVSSLPITESSFLKTDDASSEKSSCSSLPLVDDFHRKHSRELSRESKLSRSERERRSLSPEDRRENKYSQNEYYSQHYGYSRHRYRSPQNRHKSSRSQNGKSRKVDRSWDRDDDRKHHRHYENMDTRDGKPTVGSDDELRRKHHSRSRRIPSPYSSRKHGHSSVSRYSERHINPKVNRNIKPPSENIRLATQLKFKYSNAMRERSVSRSPYRVPHKTLQRVSSIELDAEVSKKINKIHAETPKCKMVEGTSTENIQKENISSDCRNTQPNIMKGMTHYDLSKSQNMSHENDDKKIENGNNSPESMQNIIESTILGKPLTPQPHSSESFSNSNYQECQMDAVGDKLKETLNKNLEKSSNSIAPCSGGKTFKLDSLVVAPCEIKAKVRNQSKEITNDLKEKLNNAHSYKTQKGRNIEFSGSESSTRNEDQKQAPRKEENTKEITFRLSKTPPSKTLVPLKLSPSFEDPAVVSENKFSLCVFNEECGFKSRRRRSVKLKVSESKNVSAVENLVKQDNEKSLNLLSSQKVAEVKILVSSKQCTDESPLDRNLDGKICNVSVQNANLKNKALKKKDSSLQSNVPNVPKIAETKDINQQNPFVSKEEVPRNLDMKPDEVSPNVTKEFYRNRSPKKRKLDSICEELKANLEKKNVPGYVDCASIPDVSGSCLQDQLSKSNKSDTHKDTNTTVLKEHKESLPSEMKLNQSLNRIIIPKRRRKIFNLQDNVVQVFSQVQQKLS